MSLTRREVKSPVPLGGAGSRWRWTCPAEDVPGRVRVAIVDHAASATGPFSYHEPLSASRAAERAALGTELRASAFVHFPVFQARVIAFVSQETAERRPACIEDGLRHAGSGEPFGRNVSDVDRAVVADQARAQIVEEVSPLVRDLGRDGADETSLTGALGHCETLLGLSVMLRGGDGLARAEGCEALEPQVNANGGSERGLSLGPRELHGDVQIPPAASVCGEAGPVDDLGCDRHGAVLPELVEVAAVPESVGIQPHVLASHRNPSEAVLSAPPERTTAGGYSASHVSLASGVDGRGKDAEFPRRAGRQSRQIEVTRPAASSRDRRSLRLVGEVPHRVHGVGHAVECRGVLVSDAEAVRPSDRVGQR